MPEEMETITSNDVGELKVEDDVAKLRAEREKISLEIEKLKVGKRALSNSIREAEFTVNAEKAMAKLSRLGGRESIRMTVEPAKIALTPKSAG